MTVVPVIHSKARRFFLPLIAGVIVVGALGITALTAMADQEYLTAGPCLGDGYSIVYPDSTGVGSTSGCSGSQIYIHSNVGPFGFTCPFDGWYSANRFCTYTTGTTWVYTSHNLSFYLGTTYYNGLVNTYDD